MGIELKIWDAAIGRQIEVPDVHSFTISKIKKRSVLFVNGLSLEISL